MVRPSPSQGVVAAQMSGLMDVLAEASVAASEHESECAASILNLLREHRGALESEDGEGGGLGDDGGEGDDSQRPWSREEDERLRRLALAKAGPQPSSRRGVARPPPPQLEMSAWCEIAESFDDRSAHQCAHRFEKVLNPESVKGAPLVCARLFWLARELVGSGR